MRQELVQLIQERANAGDQDAKRIIHEMERYAQKIEQEITQKVGEKITGITQLLARQDARTDRTGEIAEGVIAIGEQWLDIIRPNDSDIVEVR